jgi:hypothetical protein
VPTVTIYSFHPSLCRLLQYTASILLCANCYNIQLPTFSVLPVKIYSVHPSLHCLLQYTASILLCTTCYNIQLPSFSASHDTGHLSQQDNV